MSYVFAWDRDKAASNARRHGVTFDEALTVLGDPLALLRFDPDHSDDESRYLRLGLSSRGRLLVVAFADRPPQTRLISARLATRGERRFHEEEG